MNGNGHTDTSPEDIVQAANPTRQPLGASYDLPQLSFAKVGLAMVPVVPVSFTGSDAVLAWARVVVYGGLSVATFPKNKTLGTIFGSAAALSILTSLGGGSWLGAGVPRVVDTNNL